MNLCNFIFNLFSVNFLTFITAIGTLLTVHQMAKQRKEATRADLMLSRIHFEGAENPSHKCISPSYWKQKDSDRNKLLGSFSIPLRNVGLTTAKNISISWNFPIEEMISRINQAAQKMLAPFYYKEKDGMISLISDGDSQMTCFWRNENSSHIDYILPASIQQDAVDLKIPLSYIELAAAYVQFGSITEETYFLEIPKLNLILDYHDISGVKYRSSFRIQVNVSMFSGIKNFSQIANFSGYLDCKKNI